MDPTRILLAGAWIALMLLFLLGDVLRLFAGDHEPGRLEGREAAPWMWTLAAVIMMVPIAMLLVSLTVPTGPLRWITPIVAIALAVFNLTGLPYPGFYDNLLIVVSVILCALIALQAITWWPVAATG